MINPFDKTFFHLMFGFTLILGFSLTVLFITSKYGSNSNQQEYATVKKTQILKK